jgi:prephenate dehydrogenase
MKTENTPTIGIIGGLGRMGQWFADFFKGIGLNVLIADIDTELKPEDLPGHCQVVVISTPMNVFHQVVEKIGPSMPEDAMLTDFCSLKLNQINSMLKHSRCEVVGTHPLFGPAEEAITGRRIAICPARGKRWLCWWDGLLKKHGAFTYITTPEEHDHIMAWVQALNHFILLSLGKAIKENALDIEKLIALGTPSFERQLKIVARLSKQDPELYSFIQMENPYTENAINSFKKYSDMLSETITKKNKPLFLEIFREVQMLGKIILDHEEREQK